MSPHETGADALLAGIRAAGIDIVFANLGSDHPGIIESLARARQQGDDTPAVILAPHEASAIAAAHGYALASGRPQAVFVHVDVGTANLGGGVHNAARAHVPVLLFAGLTPYTLEGEFAGTRNSYPNHLQDVQDQHALVRPYSKWSYDLRTGANARQVVLRAVQIANSAPRGPVYLTAAREVLAAVSEGRSVDAALWRPIEPIPASGAVIAEMLAAVSAARFPVIVTSGYGREPESVGPLVQLAEMLGIGVVQPVAAAMGFPADHELHLGFAAGPILEHADVIIVIDSDAPWMPALSAPRPDAALYVVDADPLNEGMPLWYLESQRFVRADPATVVNQLLAAAQNAKSNGVEGRRKDVADLHRNQRTRWEVERRSDGLTVPLVAGAVAAVIDNDTIVLNEAISNAETVFRHLPRNKPGTLFASGGSSLGWFAGAAVGIKLAKPHAEVIAIVGDGAFFLSSPASAYWMSQRYKAPFLTVILDNGGWNATKRNVIRQYSGGVADSLHRYWVDLGQSADLGGIAAAAGGALSLTVEQATDLEPALAAAIAAVRNGRSAVVRVFLERIADEPADTISESLR
ncbi:thiamine pyrophosphate-requiring protein [Subtercola sp. YIM 133946]|uniref:thiamine pyrophosphate-requiring protein n=1 Tax=Subtercola sp. YIM 133946 TaxID=3118909 RepID=UPI002F95B7DE